VSIECEQTASPLLTGEPQIGAALYGLSRCFADGHFGQQVLGAETAGDGTGRKLDPRLQKSLPPRTARALPCQRV